MKFQRIFFDTIRRNWAERFSSIDYDQVTLTRTSLEIFWFQAKELPQPFIIDYQMYGLLENLERMAFASPKKYGCI